MNPKLLINYTGTLASTPLVKPASVDRFGIRPVVALLFLLTAFVTPASAQVGLWQLTGPDIHSMRGELNDLALRDDGRLIATLDDAEPQPAALLVQQLPPGSGRAAGPLRLFLVNGDAVRGEVRKLDETEIVLDTLDFGEVAFPLENAVALAAVEVPRDPRWWGDRPDVDRVLLTNGDVASGFAEGLTDGTLNLSDVDGNAVSLPLASVRLLRFADAGVDVPTPAGARLLLTDLSEITVDSLEFEDGRFRASWRGNEASLPARLVHAIEPAAGDVRWLADLPPAEDVQTPYFSASWPTRAAAGLESIAGDDPGRSLVVRSRSRLTYDVPAGGWDRFVARVGIDDRKGPMPHANADIRVLLDGEVAFEHPGLTADAGPLDVEIPLDDASTLTLVVDYGKTADVQDIVLWQRPALVRNP